MNNWGLMIKSNLLLFDVSNMPNPDALKVINVYVH